MAFEITSTGSTMKRTIPSQLTCDGENVSPEGAQSLALINDDPDAPMGNLVHWVVYDILPGAAKRDMLSAIEGRALGEATLMGHYSRR